MEFIKQNIHMNILTAQGTSEVTLEDDMNLSDAKPDMEKVILEEGDVEITEIKEGKDNVKIRGKLLVKVLYVTDDRGCVLDKMEGNISFETEMECSGVNPGDAVNVTGEVTDLSVGLINSRKISVRSLITLKANVQTLTDEEVISGISDDDMMECRCKEQMMSQLCVCKKDILRHKKEIEIGQEYPDVIQILWQDVRLLRFDTRMEDGRIAVNGEVNVAVLYEGEAQQPITYFEKRVPFQEYIEERSAKEGMLADICITNALLQIDLKPNPDGRERIFLLDMVAYLELSLYEKIKVQMLSDAYAVSQEVYCHKKDTVFPNIVQSSQAMTTVEGEIKVRGSHKKLMQVLGCKGNVCIQHVEPRDNDIEVTGFVPCKCMYITNDDMMPYDAVGTKIPFTYRIEANGIVGTDDVRVYVLGVSFGVSVNGEDNIAVRATIQFGVCITRQEEMTILCDVTKEPMDPKKRANIPQYCIYRTLENDTLWDIGKKYYLPASQIKELNGLSTETLTEGQNLLIVR